jgi:hypothetical protein
MLSRDPGGKAIRKCEHLISWNGRDLSSTFGVRMLEFGRPSITTVHFEPSEGPPNVGEARPGGALHGYNAGKPYLRIVNPNLAVGYSVSEVVKASDECFKGNP